MEASWNVAERPEPPLKIGYCGGLLVLYPNGDVDLGDVKFRAEPGYRLDYTIKNNVINYDTKTFKMGHIDDEAIFCIKAVKI